MMTAICRHPKYNGNPHFRLHGIRIRMKGKCTMNNRDRSSVQSFAIKAGIILGCILVVTLLAVVLHKLGIIDINVILGVGGAILVLVVIFLLVCADG